MRRIGILAVLLGLTMGMVLCVTASGSVRGAEMLKPSSPPLACDPVYSGEMRSTYRICNDKANHLVALGSDVRWANYAQFRQSPQPATCVTVLVVTHAWLTSTAPYPLIRTGLPPDATAALVPQGRVIASDDPAIVAAAQSLTSGITR
ncbi:MAG: hypothetical protein GXY52_07270 [Chloroflexi bacterium]|nr:hypothetical protein [Chloroflexota bacterium]